MGETRQTQEPRRTTKNSRKVATLEEQNRVLLEVLEASKTKGDSSSKEPPKEGDGNVPATETNKGVGNHDGESAKERDKRKAVNQTEGPPAKKGKGLEKEKDQVRGEPKGNIQILDYPDYENFPLSQDGEDQTERRRGNVSSNDAGDGETSTNDAKHEVSTSHGRARQEHELSPDEEEFINGEDQELSDFEDEDEQGEEGWDGQSISSSMIFPSTQGGSRQLGALARRKTGTRNEVKPGSGSRPSAPDQNKSDNREPVNSGQNGTNPVADLVKERVGAEEAKDSVGPPIEECIADLLRVFLKEPNAENVLKLVESYPRPENAEWLQAPTMGTQIAASIPKRSNSYDKRLRQSQVCLGGSLGALALVLQDIMYRGKSDPSLLPLARRVMDAMTMTGYVHADFNAIRKGAIRQVINPQYAGVFTRRTSSTPQNLMGECSMPEQLKEQEELSKVRAKLQKPKRGNQDHRNDNPRGRGRGHFSGGNRGGSQNRGGNNNQGSGFGRPQNFQQRGRGARPNYPQQRRVYGHQHFNPQDQQSGKDQNRS